MDAEDHLVVSIPDPGQILRLAATDKPEILAEGLKGVADLAITREGDLFASLPEENTVVSIRHGQKEKTLTKALLHPTGVLLWPKEGTLVVGQARGTHLMAFRIDKDSNLVDGDRYYPLRVRPGEVAETTGLTLDRAKRVYAATKEGVQIFDPTGRLCGVIPPPREGKPEGVAFAGEGRNLLLLACGDKLYALKTQANTPPVPKK
jgi:enterochelin esterase family protein